MMAEKPISRGAEAPKDHFSRCLDYDAHLTGAALRELIAERRAETAISAAEMDARLETLFAEAARRHDASRKRIWTRGVSYGDPDPRR